MKLKRKLQVFLIPLGVLTWCVGWAFAFFAEVKQARVHARREVM